MCRPSQWPPSSRYGRIRFGPIRNRTSLIRRYCVHCNSTVQILCTYFSAEERGSPPLTNNNACPYRSDNARPVADAQKHMPWLATLKHPNFQANRCTSPPHEQELRHRERNGVLLRVGILIVELEIEAESPQNSMCIHVYTTYQVCVIGLLAVNPAHYIHIHTS